MLVSGHGLDLGRAVHVVQLVVTGARGRIDVVAVKLVPPGIDRGRDVLRAQTGAGGGPASARVDAGKVQRDAERARDQETREKSHLVFSLVASIAITLSIAQRSLALE